MHSPHSHSHEVPAEKDGAFIFGMLLNVTFVLVEGTAGFLTNSLSLLADAGHNLTDVVALGLAWGARILARKKPSLRHTYGLRKATIYSSFLSSLLLLMTLGIITWEAIKRFLEPQVAQGGIVMMVAGVGILINGLTAYFLMRESKKDLNVRGAYLHMVMDAGTSLGAAFSGFVILYFGWQWADPLMGLIIVAVVLYSVIGLAKDSMSLALDGVPAHIDPEKVQNFLQSYQGVSELHDLHIWAMSTTEVALTVHLVIPEIKVEDDFLQKLGNELSSKYKIGHCTIQIEKGTSEVECEQADHNSI